MSHTLLDVTIFKGTSNPVTASHTCSNGSTILVVTVDSWGSVISTPTYNGIPMTFAGGYYAAYIYYMLDPPTGSAYTISISKDNSVYNIYVSASSYRADSGQSVFFSGNYDTISVGPDQMAISETTTQNGALIVSTAFYPNPSITPPIGNKTSLFTDIFFGNYYMVAQYELQSSAGLTTHSWSGVINSGAGIIAMSAFNDGYPAPEPCTTSTKYSGDSINLEAAPSGAVGPYHVRFFRMPNSSYAMSYGEIGSVRTITEGSSTSTSFSLSDSDLVAASGKTNAGTPTYSSTTLGDIIDPEDSGAPLTAGYIRVATTVYDSCPVGAMSCVSYCDVALGCIAPTCNFTVI